MFPWKYKQWVENSKIDYSKYLDRTEPSVLRIVFSEHAEVYKFREWVKKQVELAMDEKRPAYLDVLIQKFGEPVLYDKFNEKYKVNKEMAVFKFNNKLHMTSEDIARYPNLSLSDVKPAPSFDVTKATKIK